MNSVRLGPGDRTQAKALFALMADVFEEDLGELSDAYVDRLLGRGDFWVIAAFVGDEVVGGITAHTLPMTRTETSGLGRVLYDQIVADAKERGLTRLFLLTTTAAPFFARSGFKSVDRSEAPEAMTKSPQFASLCPSTAICMALSL